MRSPNVTRGLVCRLTLIFLFGVLATRTPAQQTVTSAALSGRAHDSSGAIVSGARITVKNIEKNQSWTTATDEQGRYNFLYLPVGDYEFKIEQPGFASITRRLTLTLGQSVDLPVQLAAAGVSENATITSDIPVIETVRTQLGETVSPQAIESLPLNGRTTSTSRCCSPESRGPTPEATSASRKPPPSPGPESRSQVNAT